MDNKNKGLNKALLIFLLVIAAKANATVFYVTASGAATMDATSWSNAAPGDSLQNIINAAAANDEVWVAAGTYYTTTGTNRNISFSMKNDVAIYGSFSGTETALSQRVLTNGLTSVLSAEIGVAGISDNSYHTLHNTGLTNTAVIDGFIIRDANDDRPASGSDGLGGGIFNDGSYSNCSPTIRNCVIINNYAVFGAGIFNSGYQGTANPVITNCVIAFNTATTGGGGIDNFGLDGNASPTITNCIVYNNTAIQRAGAMYCWGGNNGNASPLVVNSAFVNNSAVDGGGVVSDNLNSFAGNSGNSDPDFVNCIFRGNTASGTGPQFFVLGTGTLHATYSNIDTTDQISPHILTGLLTGNISVEPLFVNASIAAGNDGIWLTTDDGLQLQSNSPCINTGTNTGIPALDLLGNNRIFASIADMGPYEGQSISTSASLDKIIKESIHIYPNPSNGIFKIENMYSVSTPYQIIDVFGKVISFGTLTSEQNTIDLQSFKNGVYLFRTKYDSVRVIVR